MSRVRLLFAAAATAALFVVNIVFRWRGKNVKKPQSSDEDGRQRLLEEEEGLLSNSRGSVAASKGSADACLPPSCAQPDFAQPALSGRALNTDEVAAAAAAAAVVAQLPTAQAPDTAADLSPPDDPAPFSPDWVDTLIDDAICETVSYDAVPHTAQSQQLQATSDSTSQSKPSPAASPQVEAGHSGLSRAKGSHRSEQPTYPETDWQQGEDSPVFLSPDNSPERVLPHTPHRDAAAAASPPPSAKPQQVDRGRGLSVLSPVQGVAADVLVDAVQPHAQPVPAVSGHQPRSNLAHDTVFAEPRVAAFSDGGASQPVPPPLSTPPSERSPPAPTPLGNFGGAARSDSDQQNVPAALPDLSCLAASPASASSRKVRHDGSSKATAASDSPRAGSQPHLARSPAASQVMDVSSPLAGVGFAEPAAPSRSASGEGAQQAEASAHDERGAVTAPSQAAAAVTKPTSSSNSHAASPPASINSKATATSTPVSMTPATASYATLASTASSSGRPAWATPQAEGQVAATPPSTQESPHSRTGRSGQRLSTPVAAAAAVTSPEGGDVPVAAVASALSDGGPSDAQPSTPHADVAATGGLLDAGGDAFEDESASLAATPTNSKAVPETSPGIPSKEDLTIRVALPQADGAMGAASSTSSSSKLRQDASSPASPSLDGGALTATPQAGSAITAARFSSSASPSRSSQTPPGVLPPATPVSDATGRTSPQLVSTLPATSDVSPSRTREASRASPSATPPAAALHDDGAAEDSAVITAGSGEQDGPSASGMSIPSSSMAPRDASPFVPPPDSPLHDRAVADVTAVTTADSGVHDGPPASAATSSKAWQGASPPATPPASPLHDDIAVTTTDSGVHGGLSASAASTTSSSKAWQGAAPPVTSPAAPFGDGNAVDDTAVVTPDSGVHGGPSSSYASTSDSSEATHGTSPAAAPVMGSASGPTTGPGRSAGVASPQAAGPSIGSASPSPSPPVTSPPVEAISADEPAAGATQERGAFASASVPGAGVFVAIPPTVAVPQRLDASAAARAAAAKDAATASVASPSDQTSPQVSSAAASFVGTDAPTDAPVSPVGRAGEHGAAAAATVAETAMSHTPPSRGQKHAQLSGPSDKAVPSKTAVPSGEVPAAAGADDGAETVAPAATAPGSPAVSEGRSGQSAAASPAAAAPDALAIISGDTGDAASAVAAAAAPLTSSPQSTGQPGRAGVPSPASLISGSPATPAPRFAFNASAPSFTPSSSKGLSASASPAAASPGLEAPPSSVRSPGAGIAGSSTPPSTLSGSKGLPAPLSPAAASPAVGASLSAVGSPAAGIAASISPSSNKNVLPSVSPTASSPASQVPLSALGSPAATPLSSKGLSASVSPAAASAAAEAVPSAVRSPAAGIAASSTLSTSKGLSAPGSPTAASPAVAAPLSAVGSPSADAADPTVGDALRHTSIEAASIPQGASPDRTGTSAKPPLSPLPSAEKAAAVAASPSAVSQASPSPSRALGSPVPLAMSPPPPAQSAAASTAVGPHADDAAAAGSSPQAHHHPNSDRQHLQDSTPSTAQDPASLGAMLAAAGGSRDSAQDLFGLSDERVASQPLSSKMQPLPPIILGTPVSRIPSAEAPLSPAPPSIGVPPPAGAVPPSPAGRATSFNSSFARHPPQPPSSPSPVPTAPASPLPDTSAAVDERYLKSLLDEEFGPPKFAVSKSAPRLLSPQSQQHLQDLIEQEFGPPKFPVPKTLPPAQVEAAEVEGSAAEDLKGREPEEQDEGGRDVVMEDAAPTAESSITGVVADMTPASPHASPHAKAPAAASSSSSIKSTGGGSGSASRAKRPPADVAGGTPAGESVPQLLVEIISGPAAGRTFTTADISTQILIGRNADCTLSLPDPEVSGYHAVVEYDAQAATWTLTDRGSLNGTILNGRLVSTRHREAGETVALGNQDLVEFGSTSLARITCAVASAKRANTGAGSSASAASSTSAVHGVPSSGSQHVRFSMADRNGGVARSNSSNSHALAVAAAAATAGALPAITLPLPVPPLATERYSVLRDAHMVIQQSTGVDHKRHGQSCEDVAHWQAPLEGFAQAGLFAIFDGHSGVQAAALAKELLPGVLVNQLVKGGHESVLACGTRDQDVQAALLKSVFIETDAAIALDEGCTATILMVEHSDGALHLQTANVGDSSAVLVYASGEWVKLTEDHRIASSASERRRLETWGHTVRTRLYGLNISRMLGDRFLKDEKLGFIAEPHVSAPVSVPPGERAFLVMASDGLWDVMSEGKAAALVSAAVADGSATAGALAEALLAQAITLRSKDDITVMVLDLADAR